MKILPILLSTLILIFSQMSFAEPDSSRSCYNYLDCLKRMSPATQSLTPPHYWSSDSQLQKCYDEADEAARKFSIGCKLPDGGVGDILFQLSQIQLDLVTDGKNLDFFNLSSGQSNQFSGFKYGNGSLRVDRSDCLKIYTLDGQPPFYNGTGDQAYQPDSNSCLIKSSLIAPNNLSTVSFGKYCVVAPKSYCDKLKKAEVDLYFQFSAAIRARDALASTLKSQCKFSPPKDDATKNAMDEVLQCFNNHAAGPLGKPQIDIDKMIADYIEAAKKLLAPISDLLTPVKPAPVVPIPVTVAPSPVPVVPVIAPVVPMPVPVAPILVTPLMPIPVAPITLPIPNAPLPVENPIPQPVTAAIPRVTSMVAPPPPPLPMR